ncbi:hypothetical protein BN1080_02746 [Planococcus massiliensis]|uniref:Uncharacterized protein n=1 Tax=Planococcus massiliensis TaxID=1499687 RepID=A0A098EPN4_9BACL|nr:hypothetical protein [Planococcus massiliensis]CEG23742.1 hypothetical protein BN1080_02746 [Planococcus massiliensis]
MKAFIMYAVAVIGGYALSEVSQQWFGREWIFGLLIVLLFALFLEAWKRVKPGGAGLIFVTIATLLNIGYVFFVQYTAKAICSLFIVILLIRLYKQHKDVVLTAIAFAASYVVLNLETGNFLIAWSLFLISGVATAIGFKYHFRWLKRCFAVVFGISTLLLLILGSSIQSHFLVFAMVLAVGGISYNSFGKPLRTAK